MDNIEKLRLTKHKNYEWSNALFNLETGDLLPMRPDCSVIIRRDKYGKLTVTATFNIENVELNTADFDELDKYGKVDLIVGDETDAKST